MFKNKKRIKLLEDQIKLLHDEVFIIRSRLHEIKAPDFHWRQFHEHGKLVKIKEK